MRKQQGSVGNRDNIVVERARLDGLICLRCEQGLFHAMASRHCMGSAGMLAGGKSAATIDAVHEHLHAFGFVAVTDADYAGIRKVCDVTKAEACKAKG